MHVARYPPSNRDKPTLSVQDVVKTLVGRSYDKHLKSNAGWVIPLFIYLF